MEENQVRFYINQNAYELLKKDQESFFKDKNESQLVKAIILNHYPEYKKKSKELNKRIIQAIKKEVEDDLSDYQYASIAWDITKQLWSDSFININIPKEKKKRMHFRINKNDQKLQFILDHSGNVELSVFLANIIYSYLQKPQYERERILHKEIYDKLIEAISEHQNVRIITRTSSKPRVISPREICTAKEEIYNYLLYQGYSHSKDRYYAGGIHLYNIVGVIKEPEVCDFKDSILHQFECMKRNGVQFIKDDDIIYKVRLSEHGKYLYQTRYLERPEYLDYSDIANGIYYFDCSRMQFENYFAPFFEDITILEPASEIELFKDKYQKALENYQ